MNNNLPTHRTPLAALAVAVTVALMLTAFGCSSDTDSTSDDTANASAVSTAPAPTGAVGTDTSAPTQPATATSTTVVASTTTVLAETTPPSTAEPDWRAIVETLLDDAWRLYTEPTDDPARVAAIFWEDCDCYTDHLVQSQSLFAGAQRVITEAPEVVEVEISTQDKGFTVLTVTREVPDFIEIADGSGAVIDRVEAATPGFYERVSIALFPSGPDESWRIHAFVSLDPVPTAGTS